MKPLAATERDLHRVLDDFRERYPKLADDQLFVLWFLHAYVAEEEGQALGALTGGSKDKMVDAVFVDEDARGVFLVQSKYRHKIGSKAETRGDVLGFANLVTVLWGSTKEFAEFTKDASPAVSERLSQARSRLKNRDYRLKLFFVTTGRVSEGLREEALRVCKTTEGPSDIEFVDGKRVLLTLSDYLDGVAPPVPSLDLEMETGRGVRSEALRRHDVRTGITSWVFSMSGRSVADLFDEAGIKLFARNVRGFLGSTEINEAMEDTLANEPDYFWYYNNGITIVCDEAEQLGRGGRDLLRVSNPQVINGQQTTRTLHRNAVNGSQSAVLVRVIVIPRGNRVSVGRFESLVSKIVEATNWQNAIKASDLMANDRRQIEIERGLKKLDYFYLRKRQSKREARKRAGLRRIIKKEEVAQAVAGCDLDPSIVRAGKEALFEKQLYGHVFPTSDPYYYLPRYHLMRLVTYSSRGYPERAYAKWLVLNHVWQHLDGVLRSHRLRETFRSEFHRDSEVSYRLIGAIDGAFVAALKFFRQKRGYGAKGQDVSTFFQRKRLDGMFRRFLRGSGKGSYRRFRKKWVRFERELNHAASS